jgi:hypothetical protein
MYTTKRGCIDYCHNSASIVIPHPETFTFQPCSHKPLVPQIEPNLAEMLSHQNVTMI